MPAHHPNITENVEKYILKRSKLEIYPYKNQKNYPYYEPIPTPIFTKTCFSFRSIFYNVLQNITLILNKMVFHVNDTERNIPEAIAFK